MSSKNGHDMLIRFFPLAHLASCPLPRQALGRRCVHRFKVTPGKSARLSTSHRDYRAHTCARRFGARSRPCERAATLKADRTRADQEFAAARERLQQVTGAIERVRRASERFDAALARVFRDPAAARVRFTHTALEIGTERAAALFGAEPERFGPLKTVERRRALGLGVAHDDRQARLAAPSAALRARELGEAQHALGKLARGLVDRNTQHKGSGKEAERSSEAARREAENLVSRAAERLRRLQQQLKHAPSLVLLERSIGRAVDRLMPREIAQLRRVLTPPRAAIAFKAREVVKDIVLGREEGEE